MASHFPLEYTLENGTHVLVNKTGSNTYEFTLKSEDGSPRHFTYVDEGRTKSDMEESMEFEEVDALRTFWLKTEDVV